MQKLFLVLITLIQIPSISAMQQEAPPPTAQQQMPGPSPLDALPREIRILILRYVASADTLDKAVKGIKEFYIASPESRKSIEINKAIIKYLMQRFKINSKELLFLAKNLNTFPAFKDEAMGKWINQEVHRLNGEAELRDAVINGDIEKVQNLIKQGINVNALDKYGDSAINFLFSPIYPSQKNEKKLAGTLEILSLLILAGANVNHSDSNNQMPLTMAINVYQFLGKRALNQDLKKIIILLLKSGANPSLAEIESIDTTKPREIKKYSLIRYIKEVLQNEELESLFREHSQYPLD